MSRKFFIGSLLWACLILLLSAKGGSLQALTITEIHYQPPEEIPNLEFVEIYNETATILDLSNFYFSQGIDFRFAEGIFLEGRSYLVVCAHEAAIQAHYEITNTVGDFQPMRLENHGETLEICDNNGVSQVSVTYKDRGKWPAAPRGTGHTLSLKNPYLDPDVGPSWAPSLEMGGTPGRLNFISGDPYIEETPIIPQYSTWKYKKGTQEFSDPPAAWREPDFNDFTTPGWYVGQTGIGYGDGDDVTVLGDMRQEGGNPGYWSIAARKTFNLSASQIDAMDEVLLGLNYDDGFVAYLNGNEIAREFLGNPGEEVPFDTPAGLHEAGVEEQFVISKNHFVEGLNVLAVQIHNNTITSSDLSFIPRLYTRREIIPGSTGGVPVVINELLSRTTQERWVELYNFDDEDLDVGGYHLSSDASLLDQFTLPPGTTIHGLGFLAVTELQSGLNLGAPEVRLFFTLPDRSRVVDAQIFENPAVPDRTGRSDARYPDGSSNWVYSPEPTRGEPNRFDEAWDLVINEIMYNPFESRPAFGEPVEERPGEYIELYNRGSLPISLEGFSFTKGIQFTFTSEHSLGPGEYLVVAEDPDYMRETYGIDNVVGPWEGGLQNDDETVRLRDPVGNVVDEVKYYEGGDWPELADGEGSSLELIDPHQDNSYGSAWAASDETGKAAWTELSYTGTYSAIDESVFRFTPLEAGSFLLDDVEITKGATSYVANGGFEAGTSSWEMNGSLIHSRRTTAESHTGNACLEVIATAGGDLRHNRLAVVTSPAMNNGTYTVRFWVRWLYGGNLVLAHGFDNVMAHSFWLPVPRHLGTPGMENSATLALRARAGTANLGPIISGIIQRPVRPDAAQPVTVTAVISDSDGVSSAGIRYRLNSRGNGDFTLLPLVDDGSGLDRRAGDGIYTATLPGFNLGERILFFIEATDGLGERHQYPVGAPDRTLLYQVNQSRATQLLLYRLALDDDNRSYLESRKLHSDDWVYGTLVFEDSETYYNVGLHYHGSPWNRPGSPKMFKVKMPGDRPFHNGARRFDINRYGNELDEATAYYTIRRSGRPDSPSPAGDYRFIKWELYGTDMGNRAHIEVVNGDYMGRRFDDNGLLFKMNGKITFRLFFGEDIREWDLHGWSSLQDRGPDKESYRWNFNLHTRSLEDEFGPLIELCKAIDEDNNDKFDAEIEDVVDVEEFIRLVALRMMNDDWDGVGIGNGQNTYIYYDAREGRWKYIPWDMDHTFANAGATVWPTADPGITRLYSRPKYRRMYLQTIERMLNETWNVPHLSQFLDPITAKGIVRGPEIKNFVSARTPALRNILGSGQTFRITNLTNAVTTPSVDITGVAPLSVHTILMNGELPENFTWSSQFMWRVPVGDGTPYALEGESTEFQFLAFDQEGEQIGSDAITILDASNWEPPVVESTQPSSGPKEGGTEVTIRGSHFREGALVRFGVLYATSVEFVSPSELRAVTPRGSGMVLVRVYNPDRRYGILEDGFAFLGPGFIRGDTNMDGDLKISDVVTILTYLFQGGNLTCLEAADVNDDLAVDLSDAIRLVFYLLAGGTPPPPPFPEAGHDPNPTTLGCQAGN